MQVGSANRPNPPFGFGTERLRLVIACSAGDNFVTVLVHRSRCGRRQLRLFFRLFLDFRYLLSLGRGGADLHTENNVTDF